MDENRTWLWEKWGVQTVKALKDHGFDAHFAGDIEEARKMILERIGTYETFGFAGSHTTRSLGIVEELVAGGKTVYDHWKQGLSREEDLGIRKKQGQCDCFFCSANAVSLTGEIVNVDGVGNRTNAMSFGPKKVFIIAGMNKVCQDLASAINRIKEIAGPMRAKSLNMETPCAKTGICNDCNSPQRICRITTILHRKPMMTDVSVILVNKELGY